MALLFNLWLFLHLRVGYLSETSHAASGHDQGERFSSSLVGVGRAEYARVVWCSTDGCKPRAIRTSKFSTNL